MGEMPQPQLLSTVACALGRWLEAESVPFVLIGGMAVSLAGRPRMTQDIDVLVRLDDVRWTSFVESGARFGFLPRMADCVEFAGSSRVLLVRHEAAGIDVDIVLAGMPLEDDIIANGHPLRIGDAVVFLPRTEDLIIMKSVARRPKDIADIEALVEAAEHVDWDYVSHWTRQFAETLDAPEIQEIIETLRRRKA